MVNQDIQAALHYHDGTKHPYGNLMDRWHSFDPMSQPLLFKIYSDLKPIQLPQDASPSVMPALSAISTTVSPSSGGRIPDIDTLARILHFSAGVTKKINYPWGAMSFRAAACTGALYHIELYVVCGDLPGLEAGVYHFDPQATALRRLRQGDYRGALVDASGNEHIVANAPATIVCTDVFWRNACKYQAREYRHSFWDSGTILANTLAISSACGMPAQVVGGFVDVSVNRLLDLDPQREVALVLVPLGYAPQSAVGSSPELVPLSLKTEPISDHEIEFPAIGEMHDASSLANQAEVASWRVENPPNRLPEPSGPLIPLNPPKEDELSQDPIETVILRRGSARQFAQQSITFRQLSTVLAQATQSIPADFLNPLGATLNDIYLIVNAVDGLASGAYVFHRDLLSLELLAEGEFRYEAGYLGLNQQLPADANVNVFLLADLEPVLKRFGNRGYRAAQLEASIIAGRIYLAVYAQRLGATGLTFYDDGVTEFFSPHARGKSVMFLVALGKRARRTPANVDTSGLESQSGS